MSDVSGPLLALVKGVGRPLLRILKSLWAQKSAAVAPEKFVPSHALLEQAFRRLKAADPNDPLFFRAYDTAVNKAITPQFLKGKSVQDWLGLPEVEADLKRVAYSTALGGPLPTDVVERLVKSFIDVGCANKQEAEGIVTSIYTMLAAKIDAHVADKGTAALVVAASQETGRGLEEIRTRVDAILERDPVVFGRARYRTTEIDVETVVLWRDAFSVASSGLSSWPTTLTDGKHLPRPELSQILETLQAKSSCIVALLGVPGSGKSALLAKLGQTLASMPDTAVLAIKSDLLDTSVATEEDLQRDLNLPELPSTMLRVFASKGQAVLLVDQLDALAGHVDAKTGRLSVLLNLVKAVSDIDNLGVVMSCRTFEFTHDVRLSRINAESITLELPSWEQVLSILESNGIKVAGWNSDAREVLRVPQQLNTYLQLRADGVEEPFANYSQMLNRLWDIRVVDAPNGAGMAELCYEIAERMAETEALWLAPSRYEDRVNDMRALVSAGILTRNKEGAVGFSHQTVFEHVLARSFAKRDGRLSAYVSARASSLFVRPKLWAALTYVRAVEPVAYESELTAIWSISDLPNHIRYLLIEFMGSQPSPRAHEQVLLAQAAERHQLRPIVLKAINGSAGWFSLFRSSLVAEAMSDAKTKDLCVELLVSAWPHSSEHVFALLRDVWLRDAENDSRTLFVLEQAPYWTPNILAAAKSIMGRTKELEPRVDPLVAVLGASQPDMAIEVLRSYLDVGWARRMQEAVRLRDLDKQELPSKKKADIDPYMEEYDVAKPLRQFLDDQLHLSSVPELAKVSPSEFIDRLWPWYRDAYHDLKAVLDLGSTELGYPELYSVDYRFDGESPFDLPPSILLHAVTIALEAIASSAPLEVCKWARANMNVELAPVQRLIAHVLAHNPASTSSEALCFLLADERRYFLGNVFDRSSTTVALVRACANGWSPDEVGRFVERIDAFSPARPVDRNSAEEIRRWSRLTRDMRIRLLAALPTDKRSPSVQRMLEEAARASTAPLEPRSQFIVGTVVAPMTSAQFGKASTDDIVNAFKSVPDSTDWDHPKHFERGGNIPLAREFAEFSKAYPERALEILERLSPEFGQRAAGYALAALAEEFDPDRVTDALLRLSARGFYSAEFKESSCDVVRRLLARGVTVPNAVLDLLESWILTSMASSVDEACGDDEGSSSSKTHSKQAEDESESSLLWDDSHSTFLPLGNFSILVAVVQARLARKEVAAAVRLLRRYLHFSKDVRIWQNLLPYLVQVPSLDRVDGVTFVGEVLSVAQFDGNSECACFMARVHWVALEQVMPNLQRWRNSEIAAVRRGYGELVALIGLTNRSADQARTWLDEVLKNRGLADSRVGAAATAARVWGDPEFRHPATTVLLELLAANEAAVWHQVFELFGVVDSLEPEAETIRLMRAIAANIHNAPPPRQPFVIERLHGLLPRHPDIVARIASQLIQLWHDHLRNIGSPLVNAGQEMVDLAITLHRTKGFELEGLRMFEQLVEIDAYQAREVLDEIDHRIRPGAKLFRPRLRPRSRRRPRRTST